MLTQGRRQTQLDTVVRVSWVWLPTGEILPTAKHLSVAQTGFVERINGPVARLRLPAMRAQLSTLLALTVFTPAVAGCLLLLSWLQNRRIVALALWGSGFITTSVATALIVLARNRIPDFWSIVVGNALLAATYGIVVRSTKVRA